MCGAGRTASGSAGAGQSGAANKGSEAGGGVSGISVGYIFGLVVGSGSGQVGLPES